MLAFLPSIWDALEGPMWLLLVATTVPLFRRAGHLARREGVTRAVIAILLVALAARLGSRFGPPCWYFPMQDGLMPGVEVFHRRTTFLGLPYRLLLFHWRTGGVGVFAWNVAIGTLGIVPYWYAARRSGRAPVVALGVAALFATVPVFVRFSASDAGLLLCFFLFGIAAAAYVELAEGAAGRGAQIALLAATALLVPTRTETALLAPSVILLRYRGSRDLAELVPRRAAAPLLLGLALGALKLLTQGSSALPYIHPHLLGLVAVVVSRLLLMPNVLPPLVPLVLALPALALVVALARRRRGRELAALYVPVLLTALPFSFGVNPWGQSIIYDLAASGYHLVALTFVFLAWAEGFGYLASLLSRGGRLSSWPSRVALALAAAAVVPSFFVEPYRTTYGYQEEYSFLERNLPRGPATVLAVFDQATRVNDLDCCLVMPYPALWSGRPDLRWIVLERRDLDAARIAGLKFDYYYRGSMPQAVVSRQLAESVTDRAPAMLEKQETHLAEIRAVDELVRKTFALDPVVTQTVPARTWSHVRFPDDRMELTLFKRRADE